MLFESKRNKLFSLAKTLSFLAGIALFSATAWANGDEAMQYQQLESFAQNHPNMAALSHEQAELLFITIINTIGNNVQTDHQAAANASTASKPSDADREYAKHIHSSYCTLLAKCLDNGLNPNIVYSGTLSSMLRASALTPLHHAAFLGLPDVVQLLLDHKANYRATDDIGHTPAWYANPATHVEELKDMKPTWSLLIPYVGTAMAYSAYLYWLHHQECYELLMRAENPKWRLEASLSDLNQIKRCLRSRIPQKING